jgi:uncharacterized protein YecE (DUF72 family)
MGLSKKIHLGTSGWHYAHWRGPFYPPDLPVKKYLEYYTGFFSSVEINNTFYRLPKKETLANWRVTAPEGFCFAVKASRFITHMKKLKDPAKSLAPFLEGVEILKEKLGPILFQLPPRWKFQPARLEEFLKALPSSHRYAFEFRGPDWLKPAAYELLAGWKAAFCIYDFAGRQTPAVVTADFVYLRFDGPAGPYQGRYGAEALAHWAETILTWAQEGKDVFCYFDNDEAGYAAADALRLQDLVL